MHVPPIKSSRDEKHKHKQDEHDADGHVRTAVGQGVTDRSAVRHLANPFCSTSPTLDAQYQRRVRRETLFEFPLPEALLLWFMHPGDSALHDCSLTCAVVHR